MWSVIFCAGAKGAARKSATCQELEKQVSEIDLFALNNFGWEMQYWLVEKVKFELCLTRSVMAIQSNFLSTTRL